MDADTMLAALMEVAQSLEIMVRTMPSSVEGGSHGGGSLVRLRGKETFFLDPSATTADQVSALAAAIKDRPELRDRFLPPEVRAELEKA